MKFHKKSIGQWSGAIVAASAIIQPACAEVFAYHADHVLGTSLDMQIEARSKAGADLAWQAARAEIDRLERIFSTWRDDSEISRLNQTGQASVSDELVELLKRCEYWRAQTGGALDCRFGNVIAAWSNAAEQGSVNLKHIAELAALSRSAEIHADDSVAEVTVGATLNVDALAKGVIIDAAVTAARAASTEAQAVLIDIGGDMRLDGMFTSGGVRVGVAGPGAADNETPAEIMLLNNAAIASSGTGGRDVIIGGRTHSHIISPLTGQPQEAVETVTVIAPDAEAADGLATAFAVMGVAASLGYANSHEGIEALIITRGGSRFVSNGWSQLSAPVEKVTAEVAGVANPWPENWSVDIAYEIPKINAGDYEYPYVVAWVTDADNKPVRHLLMLGDSPRWLEENYVHWRRVGRKNPALVDHVARPTRPPGRYDIVWDGRDDQGRPVEQGEYVLHIEASREHGGHQYEKTALTLTDKPVAVVTEAGSELGKVSIAFGKSDKGS